MSQEIENNFEERKKDWDLTGLWAMLFEGTYIN